MPTTSTSSLTMRMCAVVLCFAGLTGCPREDSAHASDPDAGHSHDPHDAHEGGSSASAGHSAAGSGGKLSEGGKGGVGGKPSTGAGGKASAGSGGQAGVASGEDAGVGKLCGTRGAGACEADEFCNFEPDKDCGATDRGGSCETKPEVCDTQFAPVCGCDSRTYSNACTAHAAGVSVKHTGTCTRAECESIGGRVLTGANASCRPNEDKFSLGETPTPETCCVVRQSLGMTCGGIAALQCAASEFCNYEAGQGCSGNVADAAGKCEAKPDVCTNNDAPVCGCDSKTYSNVCDAHRAGQSSMHTGACKVSDCERIGGRVAVGIGPAPMCESDEVEHTSIVNNDGSLAIEGMLCCLKK